jgi:hypothetical protein
MSDAANIFAGFGKFQERERARIAAMSDEERQALADKEEWNELDGLRESCVARMTRLEARMHKPLAQMSQEEREDHFSIELYDGVLCEIAHDLKKLVRLLAEAREWNITPIDEPVAQWLSEAVRATLAGEPSIFG